jgi:hypothetical protein
MKIRPTQMDEMREKRRHDFVQKLVAHVQGYFPEAYRNLGHDEIVRIVDYLVNRAEQHGLRTEQELCHYVNLAFIFGRDFDEDSNLPWAGAILKAPDIRTSADRVHHLLEAAHEHIRSAAAESEPGA